MQSVDCTPPSPICTFHLFDRSDVPHAWNALDRKSTFFKLIVKFFLKGVIFMFWHDTVLYRVALLCDKF